MILTKSISLPKLKAKAHYTYIIGIDPGVNTGFAIWDNTSKDLITVASGLIHQQMDNVRQLHERMSVFVRVEDARQRKWFGNAGREQLQGAGSIKRDCKIWEDFLKDLKIDFEMVPPKNNKTKLDAIGFKLITHWVSETNEHSRDAAMLVFNY